MGERGETFPGSEEMLNEGSVGEREAFHHFGVLCVIQGLVQLNRKKNL